MTEAQYLKAWKAEIELGVIAGKLRLDNKKADLRIVASALDDESPLP